MRRERFPWIWALITVLAFTAMTIEGASAHDKGCEGNPLPRRIKLDCCGKADEHQLKPEQISRGQNDEYIVSFEGYTFVIPADRALPSHDPRSHIFFEDVWVIVGGSHMRVPATPKVHCFLRRWTSDLAPTRGRVRRPRAQKGCAGARRGRQR